MANFVKFAEKRGASYAEIISVESERNNIDVFNKEVKEVSSGDQKGFSVRVLYKGGWGTAYSYKEDFKDLILAAIKNAKTMQQKSSIDYYRPLKKKFRTKFKINPLKVSLEDKKNTMLKLSERKSVFKKVISLRMVYTDGVNKLSFINSEGSNLEWKDTHVGFMAWAYAKEGSKLENFVKIERAKCGYELMKKRNAVVDEAMSKAQALLKAKHAKGGYFPTVVDQKLAGVFAHEAVGHACEADLVLNKSSILAGKVGENIGKENITIIDDGSTLNSWGWTPFDSEGIRGSKTVLIENGILKGFLHNRETAKIFGVKPTGNGRSQSLPHKVIPRMTNTIIQNGNSKFNEMLQEVKNGYYLKGSAGGQVDTAGGEFLFNAQEGYLIRDGEVTSMVKGVSLVGNILKTLKNIKLFGKDLKLDTGYCGKQSQWVPVSSGSPHLMIENAKIGGSM